MRRVRAFALLLEHDRLALIDAEHGLVIEEPPLAAPGKRGWTFGRAAADLPGRIELFSAGDFPLAAFFAWFLERIYPIRRQKLCLILNEARAPLSISLWTHLFGQLGLREPLQLMSPLQPLAMRRQNQGLLIYLADGLAQAGVHRQGELSELSQIGYGFYLTRAIRQYVQERHQLAIDAPTARQAWQRLGGPERQLTLEGLDAEGRTKRRLLIAEELEPVFAAAFEPLIREIAHLQQVHQLDGQLLGPQADLPGLSALLARRLPRGLVLPPERERILIDSIQHYLKGQA